MVSLKGRFPFRLGTTSYILPDDILPNVRFLAPLVDDVQLVLFESDQASNLPGEETVRTLADLGKEHDLSYTVHLPLDARLGCAPESERRRSVDKCRRVIDLTQPLAPLAWNLHLDGRSRGACPADDLDDWRAALSRSLEELLPALADPRRLCAETLDYPLGILKDLLEDHGLSVCIDVGHLLIGGQCPGETFDEFGGLCRVVHLHGVRGDQDHRAIADLDPDLTGAVCQKLAGPAAADRVLTLEVFSRQDFERSMECLAAVTVGEE